MVHLPELFTNSPQARARRVGSREEIGDDLGNVYGPPKRSGGDSSTIFGPPVGFFTHVFTAARSSQSCISRGECWAMTAVNADVNSQEPRSGTDVLVACSLLLRLSRTFFLTALPSGCVRVSGPLQLESVTHGEVRNPQPAHLMQCAQTVVAGCSCTRLEHASPNKKGAAHTTLHSSTLCSTYFDVDREPLSCLLPSCTTTPARIASLLGGSQELQQYTRTTSSSPSFHALFAAARLCSFAVCFQIEGARSRRQQQEEEQQHPPPPTTILY